MRDADIARHLARVKSLERERMAFDTRSGKLIVEMGRELTQIKKKLGRGNWVPWAKANLPIGVKTAERYMQITANSTILSKLLSLPKSQLYELAEIAETHPEVLKGLTPKTRIGGTMIKDIDCCDLKRALVPTGGSGKGKGGHGTPAKPGGTATPSKPNPWDCIKILMMIKADNPGLWSDVVDDLARLIEEDSAPAPAKPTGTLSGRTRDERAKEVYQEISEAIDKLDDIDDVAGTLTPSLKGAMNALLMRGWRESNRLPAKAGLPADWRTSTGPVQGVVLRPK